MSVALQKMVCKSIRLIFANKMILVMMKKEGIIMKNRVGVSCKSLLKYLFGLGLILSFLFCHAIANAIELDLPIERPTARTEIQRGYETVNIFCNVKEHFSFKEFDECLSKIKQDSLRQNNLSEPFLLGVYFSAWYHIVLRTRTLKLLENRMKEQGLEVDFAIGEINGLLYFMDFRNKQRQIGINDITVCDVVGQKKNYEYIKAEIDTWAKKASGQVK